MASTPARRASASQYEASGISAIASIRRTAGPLIGDDEPSAVLLAGMMVCAADTGAGNRTSGPVLRSGSPRLVIQEAWAWLTATQLVRVRRGSAAQPGGRRPRAAATVLCHRV